MKITEGILPAGWIGLTLEDVAEIHDNLREPVNSSERAKRPGSYPYYGATGQVGWIDDFRQDGEYVLLGEDGAPFFEPTKEKAYLVSGKCWVNNHAHVLKGREGLCSNRYLLYALNQTNYRGYANGTTRLKLTQSAMRQLPINLAPFAEQHRIVAKIEELFSELDKGIENLKTARAQLKVYRQALLKHALEGKLTAQWRAENQDKLETTTALQERIQQERAQRYQQQLADWEKSPSIPLLQRGKTTSAAASVPPFAKGGLGGIDEHPPLKKGDRGDLKPKAPKPLPPLTADELAELPELPEGWGWVKAEEMCASVRDGTHDTPKYTDRGIPLVTSKNLRDGKIDFSDTQFISEEDHKSISMRSAVDRGDVLYAMIGTIGNPVAVSGTEVFSIRNVALFKGNPQFLDSEFLSYWLGCAVCDRVLTLLELLKGTTQKFIPLGNLRILPVPICSLLEQQQIVQILACRLSEADQLDQTLTTSLQQAEALRQSILKKAFSGQLVPQDPHDEPASALLARIKAARATAKEGLVVRPRSRKAGGE